MIDDSPCTLNETIPKMKSLFARQKRALSSAVLSKIKESFEISELNTEFKELNTPPRMQNADCSLLTLVQTFFCFPKKSASNSTSNFSSF